MNSACSNSRTALAFKTPPQFTWEWLVTLLLSAACDISIQLPITYSKVGPNRSHTNSLCQVHSWHHVNRACARFCTECEKGSKISFIELERCGQQWCFMCLSVLLQSLCNEWQVSGESREQRGQGRVEIRGRAMGQGRRQTERITRKQAGSERQAANNQERESTVQVKHGKTN